MCGRATWRPASLIMAAATFRNVKLAAIPTLCLNCGLPGRIRPVPVGQAAAARRPPALATHTLLPSSSFLHPPAISATSSMLRC